MCISPITLKIEKRSSGNVGWQNVPCGKCPKCAKAKLNAWLFRLNQELLISSSCHFITLTYNDEHVPVTPYGELTLCKKDVQNFMKRLRKLSCRKLKYFFVGEYGSTTYRPHYHAILFNLENDELIAKAWTLNGKSLGFVYAPPLISEDGMTYVLKYLSKPREKYETKQREFSLVSTGLGANYMTGENIEFHYRDVANSFVINNGFKMPLPKYYKERIYTADFRPKVTKYLQLRAEQLPEKQLRELKKRRSRKRTVKNLLKNLDISKQNLKFDARLNEVL